MPTKRTTAQATIEERLSALECAINSNPNSFNDANRWLEHIIEINDKKESEENGKQEEQERNGHPKRESED
jgi:hypothetical protein